MSDDLLGARIYCARGANKWGLGFSKWQALDACRANFAEEFVVDMLPPNACRPVIDQMGTLHWYGDDGETERVGRFRAIYLDGESDEIDFDEIED